MTINRCGNVHSDCSSEMLNNGTDMNLEPTSRENVPSETTMNDKDEITDITQDNVEDILPPCQSP